MPETAPKILPAVSAEKEAMPSSRREVRAAGHAPARTLDFVEAMRRVEAEVYNVV